MSKRPERLMIREDEKRMAAGQPLRFDESKYLLSRIVVSNIDDRVVRETLEDKFSRYGRLLGVSMHRGFAYVQYESESAAYSAIKSENDTVFLGNKIDVRLAKDSRKDEKPRFYPVQAGRRRYSPPRRESNALRDNYGRNTFRDRSPTKDDSFRRDEYSRSRASPRRDTDDRQRGTNSGSGNESRDPKTNDCEIIVFDKAQRTYAEIVEWRLKSIGLLVDILFPKPDSPLIDILEDIGNRGSIYAIVVTPQNEIHRSLTVNIMWGDCQEHRNMPMDDAMQLIAKHFENYKRETSAPKVPNEPIGSQSTKTPSNQNSDQPVSSREEIQQLLRLLAEGKQITLVQLDHVIMHLKEFREFLLSSENVKSTPTLPPVTKTATRIPVASNPEEELKKTLLNLLGGGNSFAGVLGSGTASLTSALSQQAQPVPSQQPTRHIEEAYSKPAESSRWNQGFGNSSERAQSLFGANSNNDTKLSAQGLNLDNPNVKKALDTLIQGGGSKLLQTMEVAHNSPSQLTTNIGGYLIPSQQQPQQQQFFISPAAPQTSTPQQFIGGFGHPAMTNQQILGMQMVPQQQQSVFNRGFY